MVCLLDTAPRVDPALPHPPKSPPPLSKKKKGVKIWWRVFLFPLEYYPSRLASLQISWNVIVKTYMFTYTIFLVYKSFNWEEGSFQSRFKAYFWIHQTLIDILINHLSKEEPNNQTQIIIMYEWKSTPVGIVHLHYFPHNYNRLKYNFNPYMCHRFYI